MSVVQQWSRTSTIRTRRLTIGQRHDRGDSCLGGHRREPVGDQPIAVLRRVRPIHHRSARARMAEARAMSSRIELNDSTRDRDRRGRNGRHPEPRPDPGRRRPCRAKVVLVGDPHQLPEIDAGGLLAGLARRLDPIELTKNRRQRSRWNATRSKSCAAVMSTPRSPRTARTIGSSTPTAVDVRRAMVADWWSHRVAGDTVAMTAYRRDDVDDLNGRARARLVPAESRRPRRTVLDDRPYQAGDQIVCLKKQPPPRRPATAPAPPSPPSTTTVASYASTPTDVSWCSPSSYLAAGHVTHAYAVTFHKAQGLTVRDAFVLVDDTLGPRTRATPACPAARTPTSSISPIRQTNEAKNATLPNQRTTRSPEPEDRLAAGCRSPWPSTNVDASPVDRPGSSAPRTRTRAVSASHGGAEVGPDGSLSDRAAAEPIGSYGPG